MYSKSGFPPLTACLCLLLLAGCSDGGPSDPGGELPELPEWDGRREFAATLTFAGRERSFIGHLPLSYDHERRVPLLLAYHGSGMTAELMRQVTGLDWIANDHDFAVIYPDASDGFFPTPCPGCNNEGRDGFEEIDFAREIIRWTSSTYAVHPDSVYATGFSMGGFFINYLGCAPDAPVRGIAPVAAGARDDFDGFCTAFRPRPSVLIVHALQDFVTPIEGGPTTMSIPELAELWRTHGRCGSGATEWEYPSGAVGLPTVQAKRWDGCAGEGPVRLDVIDGAGHWWVTTSDNPNGVDIGETIADYFFPLDP
jgi:polyhydroxybutyrate depolymerase